MGNKNESGKQQKAFFGHKKAKQHQNMKRKS